MRISVFGLGYVGSVTATCLAREGHRVVGVDINQWKVDQINSGQSPIVEPGLREMLRAVVDGNGPADVGLSATSDGARAVADTAVSLVCVGTPGRANGSLDLEHVCRCVREIGRGLRGKDDFHVVVVRSTVSIGTIENLVIPELEYASGKRVGEGFGVAMNPEFLREGTSIRDFYEPPITVIGEFDGRTGDVAEEVYEFLDVPVLRTDLKTAELLKFACNAFHALKVSFANEIGAICKAQGLDSHRLMDLFCRDTKLNLSSSYLRPGFAFGGSCLPKDLRALTHHAREVDLSVPVLTSVLESNRAHLERAAMSILDTGRKRVGILGLSFKAGTDDLRESPMVLLAETLLGKGCELRVYDAAVSLGLLMGANKHYIETQIPHIGSLMCKTPEEVLKHAELLVVADADMEVSDALQDMSPDTLIFDLVRSDDRLLEGRDTYRGICW